MKRFIVILLVLLLCGCQKEKACNVNEGMICFDEESKHYIIEENVHLTVAVDSEEYGVALQNLWDESFPEHAGAIEYVVQQNYDGKTYLNTLPDVGLIWANEAARLDSWFLPIKTEVEADIVGTLVEQYGECVNQNDFVYVPMFGYGWVFSYNESILNAAGVDLTDSDNNYIPDSIDGFEKINEWTNSLNGELIFEEKAIEKIFQFNWDEPYEAMTFLTAGGFKPFSTYKAEEPGWDSELFLTALSDIQQLGQYTWSFYQSEEVISEDPERQQSSTWGAEFYLADARSIFSLVGTWMYYDEYESETGHNFRFSRMPSFNGNIMSPYTQSAGYVINKNTEYPNACFELLRLIRSDKGLQAYAAVSKNPLLYNYHEERVEIIVNEEAEEERIPLDSLELTFLNDNLKEISYAMMYGAEESMIAYALDTSVRGWMMIEECGIYETMKAVFNQEITAEEAQTSIIQSTVKWMEPYLPVQEEETK